MNISEENLFTTILLKYNGNSKHACHKFVKNKNLVKYVYKKKKKIRVLKELLWKSRSLIKDERMFLYKEWEFRISNGFDC